MTTKVFVTCLGGDYSGKSTLLQRLYTDEFNTSVPVVGMGYCVMDPLKWGLGTRHGPQLRIWFGDTPGQPAYRAICEARLRMTHCVALFYYNSGQCNLEDAMEDLEYWYNIVTNKHGMDSKYVFVVEGKCDLDENDPGKASVVSMVEAWCAERHLKHVRTSAKNGIGITEFRDTAVFLALDAYEKR